ncbi:hypothetical protein FM131_03635 [Weissella confusa]|nr:hypothetical protein [Weissella confusa]SJX68310.1 hypothetical protein FM131_03635 [Weissella confusa]
MATWIKVLKVMIAFMAIVFFLSNKVALGIMFLILAVTVTGKVDWHKTKR